MHRMHNRSIVPPFSCEFGLLLFSFLFRWLLLGLASLGTHLYVGSSKLPNRSINRALKNRPFAVRLFSTVILRRGTYDRL
jgi:hypothetical protein